MWYLYPTSSVSSITLPSDSLFHPVVTMFCFFDVLTPHFLIPNSIPLSLPNVYTVRTRKSFCSYVCLNNFKSYLNSDWFVVSPLLPNHNQFVFLSIVTLMESCTNHTLELKNCSLEDLLIFDSTERLFPRCQGGLPSYHTLF